MPDLSVGQSVRSISEFADAVTTMHLALCARDDCPWKHRGVTAEATDEAARQHVVEAGHDVRRYEEHSWTVM